MSRDHFDPKSPNYSLYQMQLYFIKRSYPGGNFEENQQLNDSMSISPLYTTMSIDLHVRTPVGPPPVFQQASPLSCKDHHLSGCIRINFAQILQKNSDRQNVPGLLTPSILFTFITHYWFFHHHTFNSDALLDPCFKTGYLTCEITNVIVTSSMNPLIV